VTAIQHARKILFYDTQESNRNSAARILAAMGSHCLTPATIEELIQSIRKHDFAILIVEIEAHRTLVKQGLDLKGSPVIILSSAKLQDVHSYLASSHEFTNFVAKDSDGFLSERDLLVTVKKILNSDIFGINKYLNWGAHNMIFHLRDSATRREYVDVAVDYCNRMGLRKNFIRAVNVFCDEMLMNAFFDAPCDELGKPRYESAPRTERIILGPLEAARMEVASDGQRLVISISDPFGAITRQTVLKYFDRCFKGDEIDYSNETKKGAGLGLYFCLNVVSHFIINVRPGVKSEFIGIFDTSLDPDSQRKTHPSFHFFTTNNRAMQFSLAD
jgi:hypothetical protein